MRTMRETGTISLPLMSFDEKKDDFDGFENDQLKYSIFTNLVLIIEPLFFLFLPARFYFILNFY